MPDLKLNFMVLHQWLLLCFVFLAIVHISDYRQSDDYDKEKLLDTITWPDCHITTQGSKVNHNTYLVRTCHKSHVYQVNAAYACTIFVFHATPKGNEQQTS
jgi:hypothetical protein